eukprot:sb/3465983/
MVEDGLDEAEMFSKAEIRKFVKSFKKFGPPAKRLKEIGKDACLSASLPELEALLDCIHRKCTEAEDYGTNLDGTVKKNVSISVGGCSFPYDKIVQREALLNNLALVPEKSKERAIWTLDKKTKPTGWDVDWGVEEDSALLIGVYEHGLGSWDQIIDDPKLKLTDKVFRGESEGKPKATHLETRSEYLLKNLPKLVAAKSPSKKKKKRGKDEKSSPAKSSSSGAAAGKKGTRKSRKRKETEEPEEEGGEEKQTEGVVFRKCKEMMRPVRKTLRMLLLGLWLDLFLLVEAVWLEYLLTIGQQIEKTCEGKQEEWITEWTENLWVFVSQFTPIGPNKLKKLYEKALKQGSSSETKSSNSKKRKR